MTVNKQTLLIKVSYPNDCIYNVVQKSNSVFKRNNFEKIIFFYDSIFVHSQHIIDTFIFFFFFL